MKPFLRRTAPLLCRCRYLDAGHMRTGGLMLMALLILLTGCGRDDLGALLVRWPF
jgi:hypothetical protein